MTLTTKRKLWNKFKKFIPRSYISYKIYWTYLPSGKTNYCLNICKNGNLVYAYCEELK